MEYFRERYSGSERERFDRIDGMYHTIMTIYGYENFTCGFRLGAGLMAEVLINGGRSPDDKPTV